MAKVVLSNISGETADRPWPPILLRGGRRQEMFSKCQQMARPALGLAVEARLVGKTGRYENAGSQTPLLVPGYFYAAWADNSNTTDGLMDIYAAKVQY
jgi:hypothetical protein